jgi:DNA topoisomerase-3
LRDGEPALLSNPRIESKKTKPPSRYSEGTLIKAMQEAWRFVSDPAKKAKLKDAKGIGTPATRAEVLKGLFSQGQFEKEGKTIKPSRAGMELYDLIVSTAPEIADPGRTAEWETIFTHVEKGAISTEDAVLRLSRAAGAAIVKMVEIGRSGNVALAMGKASRPSEKIVAYAKALSRQKNIDLPASVLKDAGLMRAWLDREAPKREKNADGTYPPSEKQLSMAREAASRAGIELPSAAATDSKACSAFIDRMMKEAPRPPSEKQLNFARKLAEEKGLEVPADVETSMSACSTFIDRMTGKARGTGGSSSSLPQGKATQKKKFSRPGNGLPRPSMR